MPGWLFRPPPWLLRPRIVVPEQAPLLVQEVVEPAWTDLAVNVPGQAARAQALQELAAMRERTRVGTVLARAFDLKTDEHAWRVGATVWRPSAPSWRSSASTGGTCWTPYP